MILEGDSRKVLGRVSTGSVGLVFTSPPYYNARDYSQYASYAEYLDTIEEVVIECHRVLDEGRFLVMNTSPVLEPRASRAHQSVRRPIPFDLHPRIERAGFTFVDDIVWRKPEGAGWNAGRGRRFAADRNPLQYKPVVVTEYLMVYRKTTDRLIDWNIRSVSEEIRKA